jgi:hypothetical protein
MNSPDFENVTLDLDAAAGVIRLKAAGSFGDAVELTADVARELGQSLIRMADELD